MPTEEKIAKEMGIEDWPRKKKFLSQFYPSTFLAEKFVFRTPGWIAFLKLPLHSLEDLWSAVSSFNLYGLSMGKCKELFAALISHEIQSHRSNTSHSFITAGEVRKRVCAVFEAGRGFGYTKKEVVKIINILSLFRTSEELAKIFLGKKRGVLRRCLPKGATAVEKKALLEHPDLLRISPERTNALRTAAQNYLWQMRYVRAEKRGGEKISPPPKAPKRPVRRL